VQELKTFCWDQLLAAIGRLNGYDLPTLHRLQIYNDCWFHITRRGGFFGLHNHPMPRGAACIASIPGQHDPARGTAGYSPSSIRRSRSAMHMDAGISNMKLPYGHQVASLALEAGQLVLFPSWVLHDVKPYEGPGERITIAFNCWFTLPGSSGHGLSVRSRIVIEAVHPGFERRQHGEQVIAVTPPLAQSLRAQAAHQLGRAGRDEARRGSGPKSFMPGANRRPEGRRCASSRRETPSPRPRGAPGRWREQQAGSFCTRNLHDGIVVAGCALQVSSFIDGRAHLESMPETGQHDVARSRAGEEDFRHRNSLAISAVFPGVEGMLVDEELAATVDGRRRRTCRQYEWRSGSSSAGRAWARPARSSGRLRNAVHASISDSFSSKLTMFG